MKANLKVVEAAYMRGGSGYRVRVTFSDGSSGIADYDGKLTGLLAPLVDKKQFAKVFVDFGALTWPGNIDTAAEATYALAHGLERPKSVEDVERNLLAVRVRELRKRAGKSQVELAEAMGVSQPTIASFERAPDFRWSTMRRYVKALGGEVDVVFTLKGERMSLEKGTRVPASSQRTRRVAAKAKVAKSPRKAPAA